MSNTKPTRRLEFLLGGGRMAECIGAFDWSATPLGSIDTWPGALRTALSLVLNSRFPGFLCWGPDFISFHNDAYAPLLEKKVALGRPFREVWSEAWETVGPIAERAFAGEASYFEDMPVTIEPHGHPEQRHYTFSYSPVRDEHGDVRGILCTVFDVTSKHDALASVSKREEQLQEMNARLEREIALHTAERDRVWRMAQDVMAAASLGTGRFLTVNPAFTASFGWSEEEATSMPFMEMVHEEDRQDVARNMQVLAGGTPLIRYETRVLHKDGSHRWVSWTIVPEGELLYGVARDITAEKQQAEALRHAEEALRQSQKMEAVGQLTGGLAHDFNNMLAGIVTSLELIKLRIAHGQTSELNRYVDTALGSAERAASLTHRLLSFSRRQTLDPKPTDVNQLVTSITELIARTVGPAIRVETRLVEDVWTALCDAHQLESGLLNLAINARDAMPDGGRLLIETENFVVTPAYTERYPDIAPGEYIAISVTDTGIGMTPEVVARAFDPFFTTKPLGQGTGLGLSMLYGFVKQSKGHVRIISTPGQGTTVRLKLPRNLSAKVSTEAASATVRVAQPSQRKTILLVEDEEQLRFDLAEMLELSGYEVLQAGDAGQAMRQLQAGQEIDLLVTDVGLPNGMNGRQLAEAVQMQLPDIQVLFITGYADVAAMQNQSLPAGMQVIRKPFSFDTFSERIGAMLKDAPRAPHGM
jgi:PAS domain S-box-containing protein